MASDQETIRHLARDLAREITNELRNSGVITDVHEARRVLEGEGNLICNRCSFPVSVQDHVCPKCGSPQGIDADEAPYRCRDCNHPIASLNSTKQCPGCRSKQAEKIQRAGAEPFECIRCGFGIVDPKKMAVCPRCGEDRAVRRDKSGTPVTTVAS